MREAGITEEYLNSEDFAKSVKKAKERADKNWTAGLGLAGSERWLDNLKIELGTSNLVELRQKYLDKYHVEYLDNIDPKYKEYNRILKEKSKPGSFETAAVNIPKDFKVFLEDSLVNMPYGPNLRWADVQVGTGDLNEEDRKAYVDMAGKTTEEINASKPTAIGPYYDQNTGTIRVLYSVKSKKGTRTISSDIPAGMEEALYEGVMFDEFTSIVYTSLYNQLGAANNIAGTGELRLPGDISIGYLGQNSTGQYVVNIPTSDKGTQAVPFNSVKDMIEALTVLSKHAIARKIEAKKAKQAKK
jgi:hypothetical protein